jgi:hypothetical protein
MTERVFVSSFSLVAGMVGLYFVEQQMADHRRFAAKAKPAAGQVVDTWFETGGGSDVRYVSVTFTVAPDRPVSFSLLGSERVGDIVDVIYDPEDLWDARRERQDRGGRLARQAGSWPTAGCSCGLECSCSLAINRCLWRRHGAGG